MVRRIRAPIAARIHQCQNSKDDQCSDRNQHVHYRSSRVGFGRFSAAALNAADIPLKRLLFTRTHGPKIESCENDEEDHEDRQQRIEIPWNRCDESSHVGLKDSVAFK